MGCSSTYRVIDYPSKEKFQEDINSSIKNRNFDVVTDDSSFTCLEGSKINNDSLYAITRIQEEKETIPLRDIREIKYFGKAHEVPSAYIWLKNGEELSAENIKSLSDSTIQITNLKINSVYIPINKVNEINYKTRWTGVPIGFLCGVLAGGLIGSTGWIINVKSGGNEPLQFDALFSIIKGALLGAIIGPIVGYIIGRDNVFQFKPQF